MHCCCCGFCCHLDGNEVHWPSFLLSSSLWTPFTLRIAVKRKTSSLLVRAVHMHLRYPIFTCFTCLESLQGGYENVGCFECWTDYMIHFTISKHIFWGLSRKSKHKCKLKCVNIYLACGNYIIVSLLSKLYCSESPFLYQGSSMVLGIG